MVPLLCEFGCMHSLTIHHNDKCSKLMIGRSHSFLLQFRESTIFLLQLTERRLLFLALAVRYSPNDTLIDGPSKLCVGVCYNSKGCGPCAKRSEASCSPIPTSFLLLVDQMPRLPKLVIFMPTTRHTNQSL